jgi:hypothetical protein
LVRNSEVSEGSGEVSGVAMLAGMEVWEEVETNGQAVWCARRRVDVQI